jgi:hypothetical protein
MISRKLISPKNCRRRLDLPSPCQQEYHELATRRGKFSSQYLACARAGSRFAKRRLFGQEPLLRSLSSVVAICFLAVPVLFGDRRFNARPWIALTTAGDTGRQFFISQEQTSGCMHIRRGKLGVHDPTPCVGPRDQRNERRRAARSANDFPLTTTNCGELAAVTTRPALHSARRSV